MRDPAELLAVRAIRVVPAVVPFARGCGTATGDFEAAITDLAGELRHLADHLSLEFGR